MTGAPVVLGPGIRGEMIAHARSCLPNEACGLLVGRGLHVERFVPVANADASPTTYTLDPEGHYRAMLEAEADGLALLGAFHSHPASAAVPSRTDIDLAADPDWVWIIVGPMDEHLRVRAWRILESGTEEVPIE